MASVVTFEQLFGEDKVSKDEMYRLVAASWAANTHQRAPYSTFGDRDQIINNEVMDLAKRIQNWLMTGEDPGDGIDRTKPEKTEKEKV